MRHRFAPLGAVEAQVVEDVFVRFEDQVLNLDPRLLLQLRNLVLCKDSIPQWHILLVFGFSLLGLLLFLCCLALHALIVHEREAGVHCRLALSHAGVIHAVCSFLVFEGHVLPQEELLIIWRVEIVHALLDFLRGHYCVVVHRLEQLRGLPAKVYLHLRLIALVHDPPVVAFELPRVDGRLVWKHLLAHSDQHRVHNGKGGNLSSAFFPGSLHSAFLGCSHSTVLEKIN